MAEEDICKAISETRRLGMVRASDIHGPYSDSEIRRAAESAYRRGFQQGAAAAVYGLEEGQSLASVRQWMERDQGGDGRADECAAPGPAEGAPLRALPVRSRGYNIPSILTGGDYTVSAEAEAVMSLPRQGDAGGDAR